MPLINESGSERWWTLWKRPLVTMDRIGMARILAPFSPSPDTPTLSLWWIGEFLHLRLIGLALRWF